MAGKTRARRRIWSTGFKTRVVAEASQPGISAAQIARRYDLNANLLFNWKKKYGAEAALIPVEIVPDTVSAISAQREGFREPVNLAAPESGSPVSGLLEIDLPCGARLRCGSDVSSTHLVRVLTVLRAKP